MLPPAERRSASARLLVFTGRTGRWKGIFAVHSWVVFKPESAASWSRYDVVGWGQPVRNNGWAPDGRWFGDVPRVIVDVRGADAARLIPKIKAAIVDYGYGNHRRLSHVARTEQQYLYCHRAARGAGARGHAAAERGRQGLSAPTPISARPTAAPGSKLRYGVCSA